eukprot:jgi/Psemu1/33505/gm1.33505_g
MVGAGELLRYDGAESRSKEQRADGVINTRELRMEVRTWCQLAVDEEKTVNQLQQQHAERAEENYRWNRWLGGSKQAIDQPLATTEGASCRGEVWGLGSVADEGEGGKEYKEFCQIKTTEEVEEASCNNDYSDYKVLGQAFEGRVQQSHNNDHNNNKALSANSAALSTRLLAVVPPTQLHDQEPPPIIMSTTVNQSLQSATTVLTSEMAALKANQNQSQQPTHNNTLEKQYKSHYFSCGVHLTHSGGSRCMQKQKARLQQQEGDR